MSVIAAGRKVLEIEGQAVLCLAGRLGSSFERAVEVLGVCAGKVIWTGMGKSGLVCRKIVATFASTGTPAFFLHPAEGVHGDLGILARGDVVVAVSNSGETAEIIEILPAVRQLDLVLVAITGNDRSTLARRAQVLLHVPVEEEGCPLNLAPMTSTTVTLALGDALAAALMNRKGFSAEDFARCHPAGRLGRRLILTVEDLMHRDDAVPRVGPDTPMGEAVIEMTSKRLGFTGVFGADGVLLGIVTDGDLRRRLERGSAFLERTAGEIMTAGPKTIFRASPAAEALRIMEAHAITSLFVTGADATVCGVVHIHDLVKAGLR